MGNERREKKKVMKTLAETFQKLGYQASVFCLECEEMFPLSEKPSHKCKPRKP